MQAASSADDPAAAAGGIAPAAAQKRGVDVRLRTRALMVVFGFVPLLHVVLSLAPIILAAMGRAPWTAAWLSPALLFLLPPLLVRIAGAGLGTGDQGRSGHIPLDSPAFLRWWFAAQCQALFLRLPFLEEILRLIPGCYSAWLRLWGADIGSLVYWSPGVTILDRSLVRIGSRVVFGIGVRLNPHVLAPDERGEVALYVAPISIGKDVLVGGYSLLLPGSAIADGEVTPPYRSIHAFSRFEGGRRSGVSIP
jgi:hypothetical protein